MQIYTSKQKPIDQTMKKSFLIILFMSLISSSAALAGEQHLRQMAAKMLMVGFKGDTITADNPVIKYLTELKVGGVIVFDIDLTGPKTLGSRNITSKKQLSRLTSDIKSIAGYPILIAADQEGGRVQRLKPEYGFTKLPSAKFLGDTNHTDTTARYAAIMAEELSQAGINVNLAPELDLHDDRCPVIGKLQRAYSSDPRTVAIHAGITIDTLHRHGIMTALKHFPGHGSATNDSHYGLTDVTSTWNDHELTPFKKMIEDGKADMIMTAHIFNRQLDPDYPATLSHTILTGLLREKLGFEGVILTDDIYMQGIIDNYSVEEAVIRAINAGADMLIMGNNITTGFEPDRPSKIIDIIVNAVNNGDIQVERIADANKHIDNLTSKLTD